jgi:SEFIR domain
MLTRVFISYSHDSNEQMDRVVQFSGQLRTQGIDSRIDRYEQRPLEGWPQWCIRQIEGSEFVLVVCTEIYRRRFEGKEVLGKGKGVSLESCHSNDL